MASKRKKVSMGQCFGIMIVTLIVAAIAAFVPFTFGNGNEFVLSFQKFPIIGDSYLIANELSYFDYSITGFELLIGTALPEVVHTILSYGMDYFMYVFLGILLCDIVFAFFLLLFKSKILRTIFRVLSIIFGILMIIIMLLCAFYITGMVGSIIKAETPVAFMDIIGSYGILAMFVNFILSAIMISKQFGWFTAPQTLQIVAVDEFAPRFNDGYGRYERDRYDRYGKCDRYDRYDRY